MIKLNMTENIEKIFAKLKETDASGHDLQNLEVDVWKNINFLKQEQPVGFLETLLATVFPENFRFAPMMMAMIFGIVLGFSTFNENSSEPSTAEMLNLNVFKSHSSVIKPQKQ